jgi:hypothetical protein
MVFLRGVRRLLVIASVVPSPPFIITLMMEALSSSETSVLTRATRRNIPEDAILHKNYVSWEKMGGRNIKLPNSQPFLMQLSRKCGSLDVSQAYVPPLPVRLIGFFCCLGLYSVFACCYAKCS